VARTDPPRAPETDREAIANVLGPRFAIVAGDGALALRQLALPAGAAVLDVGTGQGNFAIYLASQGFRVVTGEPATDDSRYARKDWAANAEKAGVRDRIQFQSFDASKMPFPPQAFDAVFFFGVLHHIDEAARPAVVREALRVAKANGPVVFFEPRRHMLEKLWAEDPAHPPAADPFAYVPPSAALRQRRIEGAFMDIFIFKKASP
jgi:SAM-dependent methyltransferase